MLLVQNVFNQTRNGISFRVVLCVLFFSLSSGPACCGADSLRQPVVTSLGQFFTLSESEARQGLLVRFEASVNYFDPGWNLLFLEDSNGSGFLELENPRQAAVKDGDRVSLEGVSGWQASAVVLKEIRIKSIGRAAKPEPINLEEPVPESVLTGTRWVRLLGVVRRWSTESGRLQLDLVRPGHRKPVRVWIKEFDDAATRNLADAYLAVEGVHSPHQEDQEAYESLQLFVPGMDNVRLLMGGREDPFTAPLGRWSDVEERARMTQAVHLLRVRGRVLEGHDDATMRIEVDSNAVTVPTGEGTLPEVGEELEVVGYPGLNDQGEVLLTDPVYRTIALSRGGSHSDGEGVLPTLTQASQLRGLEVAEAQMGYPVQLLGVVTYFDADWKLLFVQDATAGVFVDLKGQNAALRLGELVEVHGPSDPGGYAPVVKNPRVRVVGEGVLPVAHRTGLEQLMTGQLDSQWVEINALVRSVEVIDRHLYLHLVTPGGAFRAIVPAYRSTAAPDDLVDAEVRIRGVCGVVSNAYRQLVAVQIFVPQLSYIEVTAQALADPFSVEAIPIHELLRFIPLNLFSRRVKIEGVVTFAEAGDRVFLQDASGGVELFSSAPHGLKAGQSVEALGFCSVREGTPVLSDCQFRPQASGSVGFTVMEVSPADLLGETSHGLLVRSEARLLDMVMNSEGAELTLQAGEVVFSALLKGSGGVFRTRKLQPGSLLRLTGVCVVKTDSWRAGQSFHLLLRSEEDIEVLRASAWWSSPRILMAAGAIALVLALVLIWVILLRRQVNTQTQVIREKLQEVARLEKRYRELYENATDIIWTLDMEGRCTSLNRAGVALFGYALKEVIGSGIGDVIVPEDRKRAAELIEQAMQGKEVPATAMGVTTKQGERRTIEVKTRLIVHQNKPVGLQSIARDITERQSAEDALRQREAQLAEAERIAGLGSWRWSPDSDTMVWSKEHYRLCGHSVSDRSLRLEDHVACLHPDDRESFQRGLQGLRTIGHPWRRELRLVRPDGAERLVNCTCEVARDSGGRVISLIGTVQDVTDRHAVENQLRRLSRVVEDSPASIIITDTEGNIEYVNPKFCAVTGYTPEEVMGKNPRILKSGETRREQYRQLWSALSAGLEWRGEFHNRKKTGELFWEAASISPIFDTRGRVTHFVAVKEDITERRSLENQLMQAQKMESVGQLAAGVAHDYNNLLTVIKGNLALLDMSGGFGPEDKESLEEVSRAADRAENLTRQLLAFSRRQVLQRKSVDLNDVVSNLVKMLNRLLGEHISLQFLHHPQLPPVEADVGMIEQVIMNLAVNARDAMPEGGQLTLATTVEEVDTQYISRVPEAEPGQHVALRVSDNGSGMSQETLDRIFEPFFTTKEVGKGTGLGLATVFGIVKQHQGWVEVESQLGQGSTFRVVLPVTESVSRDTALVRRGGEGVPGGTETILVVEDEFGVRQLARRLLQREGYQVLSAESGVAALEMWPPCKDRVDLLLTDMVMPGGMSGRQLARVLRKDRPDLRVVFMSGYSAELAGRDIVAEENAVMLPKPFASRQLLSTVRNRLDGVTA